MPILTPLPTPPATSDPATFAARADAFLAALQTMANEINAAGGTNVGNATTFEGLAGDYYAKVMKGLTHYYLPSMSDHCRGAYRAGYDTWSRNQQWGGPFMFKNLVDGATGIAYAGEAATHNIETTNANPGAPLADAAARTYLENGFKVAESQNVSAIWIKVYKTGNPANNLSLYIYSDTGGVPNAAVATFTAQSGKLHTADANGQWYRFVYASGSAALTGGTQYHIVVKSSGAVDASNYWFITYSNPKKYPFGAYSAGDATPNWTPVTTVSLNFIVELSANAQTLQASGLFDGKAVFGGTGASGVLTQSRGLCNSVPLHELMDVTNHTCYDVWSDLTKDRTFVDYGWGEDHDRVVLRCNVTTGYPSITVYSSTSVATTVTSAIDCSSGNHSIGWQISPTVVKLFVDGTTYTSGAITLAFDNLFGQLGTRWTGGGFGLAPTYGASSIGLNGFSGLPSTLGWTWTGGAGWATESAAFSVSGGKLFQNKNGFASTDVGYYYISWGATGGTGTDAIVKACVLSGINTTAGASVIISDDGTAMLNTRLQEYFSYQTGAPGVYAQHNVKDAEHEYHVATKAADSLTFRDRKFLIDGSGTHTVATVANRIIFGDFSGTAGANNDVVYSSAQYSVTAPNFPQFTAGALHESATWQGDQSALWPLLYNGGTFISVKALLGIPQNYLDKSGKIPSIEQQSITVDQSVVSTSGILLPELERFVVFDTADLHTTASVRNDTTNTLNSVLHAVDGVQPVPGANAPKTAFFYIKDANYLVNLHLTTKVPNSYLGLHKVESRGAVSANTGTYASRTLIVEPKL